MVRDINFVVSKVLAGFAIGAGRLPVRAAVHASGADFAVRLFVVLRFGNGVVREVLPGDALGARGGIGSFAVGSGRANETLLGVDVFCRRDAIVREVLPRSAVGAGGSRPGGVLPAFANSAGEGLVARGRVG